MLVMDTSPKFDTNGGHYRTYVPAMTRLGLCHLVILHWDQTRHVEDDFRSKPCGPAAGNVASPFLDRSKWLTTNSIGSTKSLPPSCRLGHGDRLFLPEASSRAILRHNGLITVRAEPCSDSMRQRKELNEV